MTSHSEFLAERNTLLEELWQLDQDLRATYELYKRTGDMLREIHDMKTRRIEIAEALRPYECAVWPFHPKRDNSWLCGARNVA